MSGSKDLKMGELFIPKEALSFITRKSFTNDKAKIEAMFSNDPLARRIQSMFNGGELFPPGESNWLLVTKKLRRECEADARAANPPDADPSEIQADADTLYQVKLKSLQTRFESEEKKKKDVLERAQLLLIMAMTPDTRNAVETSTFYVQNVGNNVYDKPDIVWQAMKNELGGARTENYFGDVVTALTKSLVTSQNPNETLVEFKDRVYTDISAGFLTWTNALLRLSYDNNNPDKTSSKFETGEPPQAKVNAAGDVSATPVPPNKRTRTGTIKKADNYQGNLANAFTSEAGTTAEVNKDKEVTTPKADGKAERRKVFSPKATPTLIMSQEDMVPEPMVMAILLNGLNSTHRVLKQNLRNRMRDCGLSSGDVTWQVVLDTYHSLVTSKAIVPRESSTEIVVNSTGVKAKPKKAGKTGDVVKESVGKKRDMAKVKCHKCKGMGHYANMCTADDKVDGKSQK